MHYIASVFSFIVNFSTFFNFLMVSSLYGAISIYLKKIDFLYDLLKILPRNSPSSINLVSVKHLKFRLPDPDDEPFLEVALTGGVKAIVIGNKRHFPKREYEGVTLRSLISTGRVKILSPTKVLEVLRAKT